MASIQQAAEWAEHGLQVTRPGKWNSLIKGPHGTLIFASDGLPAHLTTGDIRADDWMVKGEFTAAPSEEPKP